MNASSSSSLSIASLASTTPKPEPPTQKEVKTLFKKLCRRYLKQQAPLSPKDNALKDPNPTVESENTDGPPSVSDSAALRAERFKALRAKLAASSKANHADVITEHKRMKVNPAHLSKLDRKKAEAELKLAKHDAEEAGDDFERKRAWDWTIEESLAWDRRNDEKQQNRDEAGFAGISHLMVF